MKLGVFGGIVAALVIVLLIVAYSTLFTEKKPSRAICRWSFRPNSS